VTRFATTPDELFLFRTALIIGIMLGAVAYAIGGPLATGVAEVVLFVITQRRWGWNPSRSGP
jgi:hypothetical protein